MTIKELKEKIKDLPDDMPVLKVDYSSMSMEIDWVESPYVDTVEITRSCNKKDHKWIKGLIVV